PAARGDRHRPVPAAYGARPTRRGLARPGAQPGGRHHGRTAPTGSAGAALGAPGRGPGAAARVRLGGAAHWAAGAPLPAAWSVLPAGAAVLSAAARAADRSGTTATVTSHRPHDPSQSQRATAGPA